MRAPRAPTIILPTGARAIRRPAATTSRLKRLPPPSGSKPNTTPTAWRFSPSTTGAKVRRDDAPPPVRFRAARQAAAARPQAAVTALERPPRRADGARLCGLRVRPRWPRPAPGADRLRTARAPGRRARGRRQRVPVRLPDVRRLRLVEDRHVLPDELPQSDAQRSLRRRPGRRTLRSLSGYALRLGEGLRRQPRHARWGRRA